jgi:dienelactone hydrolase
MRALVLGLLAAMPLAAVEPAAPPFELPAPTGPYAVGTTSWRLTDESRQETFEEGTGFRQVEVFAWYPAAPGREDRAPYLREGLAEVQSFARALGAPEVFDGMARVRTHAGLDARPAADPRKFPVLLFSQGYIGIPSSYTSLLEDLASHGYVVLNVIHPYEVSAATLADGRVVSSLGADGKPRKPVQDLVGEWAKEDEAVAEVGRQTDEAEQLRLLRTYLSGLQQTNQALRRWVDDTKLVLDRLPALPPASPAGRLAARIDPGRVGVFGHSIGGVTAGQFCVEDGRCKAGLNLDGSPQYGTMIDRSLGRPFLMVYSIRPGRVAVNDPIYRRAASPYVRVDVRGMLHLDFTDMVLWGGPLRGRPILGKLPPERSLEITRAVVREFFDQQLRGRKSKLLAGKPVYPEVTVRVVPPPAR